MQTPLGRVPFCSSLKSSFYLGKTPTGTHRGMLQQGSYGKIFITQVAVSVPAPQQVRPTFCSVGALTLWRHKSARSSYPSHNPGAAFSGVAVFSPSLPRSHTRLGRLQHFPTRSLLRVAERVMDGGRQKLAQLQSKPFPARVLCLHTGGFAELCFVC